MPEPMSAMHSFPTICTPRGPVPRAAPRWNPQRSSSMPSHRYRSAYDRVAVPLTGRSWPQARIESPPLWVPVDLRDGNQALAEPMDTPRKRRMFDLLVAMGFKEIEVGYPSASRTDFDFVRHLVTSGAVPDDVTPVVFTPARADLIDRTFESMAGLDRVVVHLYIATAPVWREVVLGRDRAEVHGVVLEAARQMDRLARSGPGADIRFQFSPEVFNLTEPDYVLEICDSLTELWDASPDRPVVHNLPATVEIATPNVYADQIEYMHRHLARRDSVILSVHPHNDRGTGVACAELAVLAGAQRVEGCLFGNGERTGNVDLVNLALNLHAQGVDPMIDFSDIDEIRRTVEHCNRLPVPPRHPYGGDLVYTAFSGTHQDAISKGFARRADSASELWEVPYLPIDPADVGRTYEAVIRVNSQSGKGGIAHLLRTGHGVDLPAGMRAEFSRTVQEATDDSGAEATGKDLWNLFEAAYLVPGRDGGVALTSWSAQSGPAGEHRFVCTLRVDDREGDYEGTGTGPVTAFADALAAAGVEAGILELSEQHPDGAGTTTAYARCRTGGEERWGAGRDVSGVAAAVAAVLSAVNRARP
ncbi:MULTISPECIES: 2-isopropylmalate synthase [unclassified Streptomyces]|uniref:2-isopropylmalate synthase n=1 Tax=unclassified Streptomyces TaxID=2593676 RepID=UPI000DADC953|nr:MULTISPECIES: 2-isopropylmalate synthase [unclassified Streptomyces]PZT71883.1 2-isopropylmalate synthase [Streptomyces sp. AC1-42T]PZT81788.1 2-isopropylmalate synthase [Streptomyces sp. AC1-42W]